MKTEYLPTELRDELRKAAPPAYTLLHTTWWPCFTRASSGNLTPPDAIPVTVDQMRNALSAILRTSPWLEGVVKKMITERIDSVASANLTRKHEALVNLEKFNNSTRADLGSDSRASIARDLYLKHQGIYWGSKNKERRAKARRKFEAEPDLIQATLEEERGRVATYTHYDVYTGRMTYPSVLE